MVLAGVLMGALSLVQRVTHTYGKDYAGFAVSHPFAYPPDYDDTSSSDEPEGQAFQALYPSWRALGSIGDANYYAQIMIVLIPIALLRFWASSSWRERTPALLASAAISAGVVLSYSRGGAIAVFVVVAGLIAFRYLRLRYVLPVIIAALLILAITEPMFIRRIQTLGGGESGNPRAVDRSILLRRTIIIADYHIFLDHPLLGVGYGQAPKYIPWYGRMYGYAQPAHGAGAHSMYLEILAETGIAGFGVFMLVIWAAVKPMVVLRRYWARSRPEYAHTLASLMLGLLAFLAAATFLHLSLTRYLYLLLGLCGAASAIYAPQAESPATVPLKPARTSRSEIGAAWYEG
jgi:O-antigen ligase